MPEDDESALYKTTHETPGPDGDPVTDGALQNEILQNLGSLIGTSDCDISHAEIEEMFWSHGLIRVRYRAWLALDGRDREFGSVDR